ncbi:zinc finger protein 236-like [Lineus longissimus]|uniref:zinc finger protein 236-like n=1 Tax=Lineus longissimus TaxID=88925 RepID=UPI002B4CC9C6
MDEIPSTSCQGNVANIVLIPDQTGDQNSAAVAALQQQIIAIVTDAGQQVSSPASTVGTIFHDMGQDINCTFTQAMTTLQQPMMQTQPIMQNQPIVQTQPLMESVPGQDLTPLTGHVHTVTEVGENTDATLAAFEAITVLADASNRQGHGEVQDLEERKVYSSVKASLSKSLVSEVVRKAGSLESVLTNIATQLSIRNILCEYDEGTGVYTLDGDVKELVKLQDVLIHYYDENIDFNVENISPSKAFCETKDQGVACDILRTPVTKSKSGRLLSMRICEDSFDNNDAEYGDDMDDEYVPTIRNKRRHLKRKREPPKKLREIICEFPGKASTSRNIGPSNMSNIPVENFTSILGPVSQTVDDGSKMLKFEVQPSLLGTQKLETPNLQEETMLAQSNEDVVSLLEKPLEGDDARGFINISNLTGVVQAGSVEAEDFAKYVDMDANDLLAEGTSVLGGDVEKPELKPPLELPPVTLSDEEAMAAMEREEVEQKIRVAKGKVMTSPLQTSPERKTKKRKDYDSLMPYKYHCEDCSFKSKRESHYIKHMKIHKDNPDLTILKCKVCDFRTIRQCHLKRHQAEHSAEILQCGQCSYKTTDEDLLKKHTVAKHLHGKPPSTATVQHCPKCNYKTTRPYHFERHLRVHADILGMLTGEEDQSATVNLVHSYQCPKCPYHTKKKEHFVRHLGDVHSEHRPYLCDTCGKSFKRADALKQHRDVHVDKMARMLPYTCVTCKKSFKSKAHMNDHKTKHTNVRAYLCEICGASFKTKSVQRKHIISIHRNPRAYRCPHCDKRFNTKFALQRHSTTHMVPDGLIRTTDVPMSEHEVVNIDGQQETQYIQVEVNPSSQLTTIQTIPIMQMENAQVQDVIMKSEDSFVEQADGTRIVPQMYSGPGEATTALLYLTTGNFPGSF